jgi:lysophospholipid acyltransferase (LPLAT)-like uncharacterized protein
MASPESPPSTNSPDVSSDLESLEDRQKRLARRSRIIGASAHILARTIFATMRLHCENLEGVNPGGKGSILVTWHGRSFIPACLFRNRGYWALISLSKDGELQNNIFRRLGFQIVRGSSGRGGVRGALQMARKVKEGAVLAFTPDGPRGPTHKVQPGVVLMAEKSGAPIVPIGVSAARRWQAKSWDSYMVPHAFTRGYALIGEPIYVPPKVSEGDREAMCIRVEAAINRLEKEAERRAGHIDYPPEWRTE